MTADEKRRSALKKQFLQQGLSDFDDAQMLELMLLYTLPPAAAAENARRLAERFGSFAAVLDAPVSSLEAAGLSSSAALYIKLFPELCQRYYTAASGALRLTDNPDAAESLILPHFINKTEEKVLLILLNDKDDIVFCRILEEGMLPFSEVMQQRILQYSVEHNAAKAILAHNAPGGLVIPTERDLVVTDKIRTMLNIVGVYLAEHYIVSGSECCPMSAFEADDVMLY